MDLSQMLSGLGRQRRFIRLPITACALLAILVSACHSQDEIHASGMVLQTAAYAKGQGQTETRMTLTSPPTGNGRDLSSVARDFSFLLVRSTQPTELVTANDLIETWHRFALVETLVDRGTSYPICERVVPKLLRMGAGDVVMPLFEGTVAVNGVKVTAEGAQSAIDFRKGQTYVLVAAMCSSQAVYIPFARFSIFPVVNGRIVAPEADGVARPFVDEIGQLGTVDSLKRRLVGGQ
jgi:hypothetical protein